MGSPPSKSGGGVHSTGGGLPISVDEAGESELLDERQASLLLEQNCTCEALYRSIDLSTDLHTKGAKVGKSKSM
jgi:hypothetical protein